VDIPAGTDGPEGPIAANGSGLAVQGGRIIRDSVLNVFDVSDPTNTDDFLTQFDLPRVPTGISLAGGIAIVSDGTSGVQVVNFLPFDSAEVAPTVTVQPDFVDVDGGVAGIQVVEGTSLPFKLDVTDDVQVRSVELLVDGVPFASDITFPYELTTPGISATAGNRLSTQIRVTDGGGNSTVSDPIIVDLVPDTVAPSILLQDPEPNSERSRLQRQFRITFDEPMNVNTLTTDNFQMFDPAGNLIEPELIQVGFNDTSVTLSYPEMVEGSHQFRINEAMITDRVGNRLGSTTTVSTFDVLTSTAFWIGASGNFNDPSNWSNGVVPGPTDDVLISVPGDQTITVNAAHTLLGLRSFERFNIIGGSLQVTVQGQLFAGLEMSGGTAGGSAPLEVYGDSTFGGGAIVGFGGLSNMGQMEIQNNPTISGVFTNAGNVIHTASDLNFNSATVRNLSDAIYEIRSGQLDANAGFWNFENEGTIRKTSEETVNFDVNVLQSGGTIEVVEGNLNLIRGGQHLTGHYRVAADAVLNYANGTYDFFGLATGDGDGIINVQSTWRVPDGEIATLDFEGDVLQWNSTSFQLNQGLENLGEINLINGPSLSGVLNNRGTINHSASDLNFNSATINNLPGGVYEIRSGQLDANSGFWNFNNEGTIRKVGDTTALVDVFLSQQTGIVDIQEGQLDLTRGGVHTGGTYSVAADAILNYANGTYAFVGLVSPTGEGTVNVNSTWNVPLDTTATLNFPGDLLQWNTTTYDLDGPLSNIGTINWNGNPSFNGILNNEGLIVHNASDLNFNSATINNRPGGVYEIRSGQLDANTGFWNFNNEGTIRKVGDNTASFDVFLSQQAGVVDIQEGQLNLTRGGSHTGGTYAIAEDASLNYVNGTFTFDGMVSPTGNGTVNVNSTWSVPTGVEAIVNFPDDMLQWNSTSYNFDGLLTNLGTVNWNGSSFLRGPLDNEGLIVHNASDLNFNSATINNRAGSTYEIQSGQLDANSGFWNFNNDGTIRVPADAAGTMDVFVTNNGLIELLEGGALNFTRGLVLGNESRIFSQIGGTSSSEFGKLATNAGLTLAGTLEVDTVGGFAPAGGDSFRVVAYTSSSGDFSSFDDNGTGLGYALNATGVDVGLGLAIASTRSEAEFSEEEDRGVERVKRLVELVFADFNE
jgi:Zn/Cd-binding protein ZinT